MRGIVTCLFLAFPAILVGCGERGGSTPTTPGAARIPGPLLTLVDVAVQIDVTAGGTGTDNWAGQSVTVPAGRFNNLRFHWYTFHGSPTAFGSIYLLQQEYLGLPGELTPSMAGFIARSERIVDGEYVFAPGVTLSGETRYWFYSDTRGSFAGSFDTDIYPGGDEYITGLPTMPFRKVPASGRMVGSTFVPAPPGVYVDANFRLQGSAATQ